MYHGVIEQLADCFERGTASASALSTQGRCGLYWQIPDTPEDEHVDKHVREQPKRPETFQHNERETGTSTIC